MNQKWVFIISGILLLLGIPAGWPYSYYILLRWLICAASIYAAYNFYQSNLKGWTWVFGTVALVFNPIFPFYFVKETWVLIDIISAVLFLLSAYSIKKKT